nr:putative capsid [Marmot picobirnavirus]
MAKPKGKSKKRFSKPRAPKDSSKNQRRDVEIADTADKALSTENDISWWTKYPQLAIDAGSLPMAYATGAPFSVSERGGSSYRTTVPGIISLHFIPTYGTARSATDPINIAARNIYSFVRHANSGSKNYDAPDLIMYLMGMDNAFAFHAFARRIYGIARDFSPTNRYYSDKLLIANGLDPDDVYEHGAQLRYAINLMATKLGSLCVPSNMDIFVRHSWMSEGLYVDSASSKAQTYMFVPDGFWQVNVTGNTGTKLVYKPLQKGFAMQVENFLTYFDELIAPLWGNEDFNIMSGDILKAYGDSGVMRLFTIPEDYAVLPTYSQEVLSEIENALACPFDPEDATNFEITQNPNISQGYVAFDPTFPMTPVFFAGGDAALKVGSRRDYNLSNTILNFHHDRPTPGEVLVASRMQHTLNKVNDETVKFGTIGTEIVTHVVAWMITPDNDGNDKGTAGFELPPTIGVVANTVSSSMPFEGFVYAAQTMAVFSNFDWHPFSLISWYTRTDLNLWNAKWPTFFGDFDVYTTIDENTLQRLHEVALLSVFDVPQAGLVK